LDVRPGSRTRATGEVADATRAARPHGRHRRPPEPHRFEVATDDRAWDAFVASVGGSHTQASVWAQVKATLGWQALRVVARRGDDIVGGAQLLVRPVRGLGAVGYVANGPVLQRPDPSLADQLLAQVRRTARSHRVQHVTMQPFRDGDVLADALARRGDLPSTTKVTPQATSLLDLGVGTDGLLAGMSARTRYNVRLGPRRGLVVREGDERDLEAYTRLLRATATRQGFVPLPDRYFTSMWDVLHPRGHLRLTVAELDGEVLAAQLAVAFGDTVTNKMSVWSGRHGAYRPNEAIQWSTIRWAAERGYRWYDLEGIALRAARALLAGEPLPDSVRQSVTSFKLGFGGRVVVLPPAYEDLYNPALRWGYTRLYPRVRDHRAVRRFVKRVRTRPSGAREAGGRSHG
jgi:lipid II:glycine glycyltransferase (peptidoglycan interpeptide bridge formation enzyme)